MNNNAYNILIKALKERRIAFFEFAPIKKYSTIGIGVVARLVVLPKNIDELLFLVEKVKEQGLSYYALSGGSNTLFCAEILSSVVILMRQIKGITKKDGVLEIFSGTTSGETISFLAKNKLSSMEKFVGVPSRIGGMVAMNFGCYNLEMKDIIKSVLAITEKGVEVLPATLCDFSYRHSRFQKGETVVSCDIKVKSCENVKSIISNTLSKRKSTQPLSKMTLGCIFKSDNMPSGYAIETSGLKGKRVGNARISPTHCGFIENTGGATFEEVLKLMDIVEEKVYNELNIRLTTEINKVF